MHETTPVDGNATDQCGIIGADATGRITLWNDAATSLLGHRRDDVVGRNVDVLVPAEHIDAHRAGFARAMAGGPRSADAAPFHLPVVRSDRALEVFAVRFVFLDDAHGHPRGALILLTRAPEHAAPFTSVAPTNEARP